MKKTLIISVVIVFVVILSGCGNKNQEQNQPSQDSNQQKADEKKSDSLENKITGTIKDLLEMGKSLKCTATSKNDKFFAESVTYVSGKKVRSDVTSQVDEATKVTSHIIILDDWMYNWSDNFYTGTKFNMSAMNKQADMPKENADKGSQPFTANSPIENKSDFDCSLWVADDSIFAIPSDVTFTDQTQAMNGLINNVQQKQKSTCEMCDTIPNAEAKTQCKATCSQQQ